MTTTTEGPTRARPRYQRKAAVAAMLGIPADQLAHEMKRHPGGIPEPDADEEGANGKIEPLWLPRPAEWQAWRRSFPGRTGRPRRPRMPEADNPPANAGLQEGDQVNEH